MNPNFAKTDGDARAESWRPRDVETFAGDKRGDFAREREMLREKFLDDEKKRDLVGINIVAEEIVDPRMELSDAEITEKTGANSAQIAERRAAEERKMRDFERYVDGFGGELRNARIHPYNSPLDPKNAVRADGSVKIANKFVEQMNFLTERGVKNLEFVMPMLDPSVPAETIAKIVDDLADRLDAQNLTITLGNETNILPEELGDGVETTYFSPENYAKIYENVARAVKSRHQNVKLGLAAAAFFDAEYAEKTLAEIDDDLVDQISFNPYRDTPWSPARQVRDGKIADAPEEKTYAEQENRMKNLAQAHGAELVVDEVQFSKDDPDALAELEESMENSAKNGVKSYLWPRKTLPF